MAHFLKSDPDRFIEGGARDWLVYFASWIVPVIVSATVVFALDNGGKLSLFDYLVLFSGSWYLWALAAPIVYRVQFVGFGLGQWEAQAMRLGLHVGLLAVLTGLSNLQFLLVNGFVLKTLPFSWTSYAVRFEGAGAMSFVGMHVVMYVTLVFPCILLRQMRLRERHELRRRQAELQNKTLLAELSEAKLTALRNQIHPHLLFNALNCVASLIEAQRNDAAYAAVSDVAVLLRQTLDQTQRDWILLKEDIDLAKAYLRVAALRFDDRIDWSVHVDPKCETSQIAPLLAQPLVENAVRHGVERTTRPVRIELTAGLSGSEIEISVSDTGPGFENLANAGDGSGVGLRNLRERLILIYGNAARLEIDSRTGAGARVRITVPHRVSTDVERAE